MPPPPARSASTLTSSGAPTALAAAAILARSAGLRSGSRPTLLSPHTTRSGRLPASPRVAASLARKRASTWSITPGCTSATRIVWVSLGAGRAAAYASVPATSTSGTPSPARVTARRGMPSAAARTPAGRGLPGRRGAAGQTLASGTRATATPTLTATSRKPTAQTPPTEASASTAGWFHWLAPSSPQGPPNPCHERTYSPATQALGTSSNAASTRPGPGRPCSSAQASQPHGSQQAPSTSASSGANGPTLLSTNESTAKKKPAPPSQAATAASRPLGAERTSTTSGARPKKASHHSEGRGKASASGAPSSTASPRRAQRPRRRRLAGGAAVTRSPASADSPRVGAAGGGLLDAAERRGRVGDHALVEPDHAGLEALDHPEGALQVAGVDVGDQAVLGVVGRRHRRLFGVERRPRRDRAEDLLLEHARVAGHAGQHGGLVEVAAAVAGTAADHRGGALAERVVDQLADLLHRRPVDQRAHLDAVVGAAADPQRAHALGQPGGEALGERLGHVEAVGRGAGFADVTHLGDHRALDREVDVGVVEDQERGVAAELHGDAQDLVGRLGDERAADLGGAGERQLAGAPVLDQRLHHRAGGLGDDHVEHPGRQAALLQDAGEGEHRQRRLLGGLDHHGAAGGDGRADLAGAHRHGEVPRRDQQAGPDRLAQGEHAALAVGGDREAAGDPHPLLGEPAEELGRVGDLRLRLGQRLAHLQGHQQGEVVALGGDALEGAPQDLAALPRRVGGPGLLGVHGRGERGLAVGGAGAGHLAQRLAGGGVLHLEGGAALGVPPLPADQQLGDDRVDDPLLVGCDAHGSGLPRAWTGAVAALPALHDDARPACDWQDRHAHASVALPTGRGRDGPARHSGRPASRWAMASSSAVARSAPGHAAQSNSTEIHTPSRAPLKLRTAKSSGSRPTRSATRPVSRRIVWVRLARVAACSSGTCSISALRSRTLSILAAGMVPNAERIARRIAWIGLSSGGWALNAATSRGS